MKADQRKEIQELVEILTRQNLTELEIERKDIRIRIRRDVPTLNSPPPSSPSTRPEQGSVLKVDVEPVLHEASRFVTVISPIVGTFYRSPSPDADPYVEEGDLVKKGQVICIIEAMKLMNEIESEADGRIVKILLESASSVEYGQPLFLLDPVSGL